MNRMFGRWTDGLCGADCVAATGAVCSSRCAVRPTPVVWRNARLVTILDSSLPGPGWPSGSDPPPREPRGSTGRCQQRDTKDHFRFHRARDVLEVPLRIDVE